MIVLELLRLFMSSMMFVVGMLVGARLLVMAFGFCERKEGTHMWYVVRGLYFWLALSVTVFILWMAVDSIGRLMREEGAPLFLAVLAAAPISLVYSAVALGLLVGVYYLMLYLLSIVGDYVVALGLLVLNYYVSDTLGRYVRWRVLMDEA